MALACRCYHAVGSRFVAKAINKRIISSLHELNNWPFREAIKHGTEIIKGELAQVLSFQELIKFDAVMRSTCQSWGILHSEKRGKLAQVFPGSGCALPGLRSVRPAFNLFTIVAETAGVGGLNIAETFPAGRGSPQGCGLRAVFLHYCAFCSPGKRRATGERLG
ncbi:conserved hypothetical protein [Klebsiella quasipneumoniae subsp. similipneumoniae]|nr:conserved hypothetical protein [Klebsiella quasipneumoniae subsp. similipneumoniae]